jgi:hypothetical protein
MMWMMLYTKMRLQSSVSKRLNEPFHLKQVYIPKIGKTMVIVQNHLKPSKPWIPLFYGPFPTLPLWFL